MFEKRVKIEFVDACMLFKELHEDLAKNVSHYAILDNSEAIEIHYKNGSISVWDPTMDFEVKVRD